MDTLELIWTAAPEWKVRILALITLAQMVLAVRLYGVMAAKRTKAVKAGVATVDTYKATQNEPEEVAIYSRVVTNQFEAPVIFYALIAMSLALGVSSWITVVLAAAFVALRWQHANEMIGPHVVLKRRAIFLRSFKVLIALMAEFAISMLLRA